ncbi:MAG TPA: DUF3800 domain-containing protein [Pyrinomonadaceae bacterium]|nr:DUF3800 domain-containing protein [Pyrinomonadaceae bacterium]
MLAEIGLSGLLKQYSPTRHLASAIFPFSAQGKFMVMLTAYMDETGHSQDEKQRFNGMAGLLAPTWRWEELEPKWKQTLKDFKISCFHMKDFANRKREFEGWHELKRKKLYGKLLKHIEMAEPYPVGSILAMSDFLTLRPEQQAGFGDPYHVGFLSILAYLTHVGGVLLKDYAGEKIAAVFSDHVEFRHSALQGFELMRDRHSKVGEFVDSPVFRDMRVLVPLQAADVVAYELYKEFERQLFRQNAKPRYGYEMLCKMSSRLGFEGPMFAFHNRESLNTDNKQSAPDWGGPKIKRFRL